MRQAFQHVRRLFQNTPVFAITVVVLLAGGIGASASIFALVNAVLIRPLPYADADQLVAVHHFGAKAGLPFSGVSAGTFLHYQNGNHVFAGMGIYRTGKSTLRDNDSPEEVGSVMGSPSLFAVLRVRPFRGTCRPTTTLMPTAVCSNARAC